MILHALVEYYRRKQSEGRDDNHLAPEGFEYKEIPYLIIINDQGEFYCFEDTRESHGKKKIGKKFLVPNSIGRSGRNPPPNYLWDNIGYVLGLSKKETLETLKKKNTAFIKEISSKFPNLLQNRGIQAILNFYKTDYQTYVQKDPLWEIIFETCPNVTFRIVSDLNLICEDAEIHDAIASGFSDTTDELGFCLVTGLEDMIATTHPLIKGVKNAQTTGGKIVSVNFDSAESHKKTQGLNSPVGKKACFSYSTALNHLLKSKQRIQLGDATTVFWAAHTNPMEDLLIDIFGTFEKDNPDSDTQAVKALYTSPYHGILSCSQDETSFYILGLSPNISRLSVRFWWEGNVKDLATNIRQHFEDLNIVHESIGKEFLSLKTLLRSIAFERKEENLPPILVGNLVKSIINNTNYPYGLLSPLIRRIQVEGINHPRAALLKAWINRHVKLTNNHEKEITVSMDESNMNVGYRLGRLFAVLEKVQQEASPGINSTIRDRFYSSAASAPITAFPALLKLKNHHLAKLKYEGRIINFEKIIGEILSILTDFPNTLDLVEQGRFALGYYHQRQQFFIKKEQE